MLSFKPRQMTETDIIQQLKIVIDACENEDFKSKRFTGLLNDYIPYQNGLKIRLELLGRSGSIEQMRNFKKESNQYSKIEKLAAQFSKEYGFVYEEILSTVLLVAKALALNTTSPQNATLKIVSSVQSAQGNFSKKHLTDGSTQTQQMQQTPKLVIDGSKGSKDSQANKESQVTKESQISKSSKEFKQRKKFIRCKSNLVLYLSLLILIPVGFLILNGQAEQLENIRSTWTTYVTTPFYSDSWFIGTLLGTSAWIVLITAAKWGFKKDIIGLLPLGIALAQAIFATLQPRFPDLYIGSQLIMGVGMWLSFAVVGFYAMRLPKGAKEFLSYKAIIPYYLSVSIWLIGQYLVLQKMIGWVIQ